MIENVLHAEERTFATCVSLLYGPVGGPFLRSLFTRSACSAKIAVRRLSETTSPVSVGSSAPKPDIGNKVPNASFVALPFPSTLQRPPAVSIFVLLEGWVAFLRVDFLLVDHIRLELLGSEIGEPGTPVTDSANGKLRVGKTDPEAIVHLKSAGIERSVILCKRCALVELRHSRHTQFSTVFAGQLASASIWTGPARYTLKLILALHIC